MEAQDAITADKAQTLGLQEAENTRQLAESIFWIKAKQNKKRVRQSVVGWAAATRVLGQLWSCSDSHKLD
jgi:hypothetical protein